MEPLFAPWRMAYIRGKKTVEGCVFCNESKRCEDLILHKGRTSFVLLNAYPYISGHLMIVPLRHVSRLQELSPLERVEIFDLMDVSVEVLREAMQPDGFNIGMNLGKAAGAGIDDHLHVHVVPRWSGDTNYMSVVGEIRVIPEGLEQTRENLLPYFRKCIGREDA